MMKTRYFTFGQAHAHPLASLRDGVLYDNNTVVQITAEDPRAVMMKKFGLRWGFEYEEPPDMSFYPNGIVIVEEVG